MAGGDEGKTDGRKPTGDAKVSYERFVTLVLKPLFSFHGVNLSAFGGTRAMRWYRTLAAYPEDILQLALEWLVEYDDDGRMPGLGAISGACRRLAREKGLPVSRTGADVLADRRERQAEDDRRETHTRPGAQG